MTDRTHTLSWAQMERLVQHLQAENATLRQRHRRLQWLAATLAGLLALVALVAIVFWLADAIAQQRLATHQAVIGKDQSRITELQP